MKNKHELQYKLLYSIVVAGKSAKFAKNALGRFLQDNCYSDNSPKELPFDYIKQMIADDELLGYLEYARTGNYTKLDKAFREVIKLNPETCTVEDLEAIHGIGYKTSRFFMLWTREGCRYAALDTHILKYLRSLGYDAPKSTPTSSKKYIELENIFLKICDEKKMEPRDLDYEIWQMDV